MSYPRLLMIIMTLALILMAGMVSAEVPQIINYQGRLTDAAGDPVADGLYQINFKIYGSESGDDSLWWSDFQSVDVIDGLFEYPLGSNTPIPADFFGPGSNPFLGIIIDTDPEITPRTPLTSVAFSFYSGYSDTASVAQDLTCTGCITSDHIATNAVSSPQILNNSITEQDIGASAVTSNEILDGTIELIDLDQNGASSGQIMKWNGTAWDVADDETGSGGDPNGWVDDGDIVRLETANDSVGIGTSTPTEKLEVAGGLRVTGKANIGTGNTNPGTEAFVAGEDNSAISNYTTVSGGADNYVAGNYSAIGGGQGNGTGGYYNVITGGQNNHTANNYTSIAGGRHNRVSGSYSFTTGFADTVTSEYSYLFGIDSDLDDDSTFMVDLPHIRFGDASTGYEFPEEDGATDQVMTTNGSGQLSWTNISGNDGDWTISGNDQYSAVSGNVGIGTSTPSEKLSVINTTSGNYGLIGGNSFGVSGVHSNHGNIGILGSDSIGVEGWSIRDDNNTIGVFGNAEGMGDGAFGVMGKTIGTSGASFGVYGSTGGTGGYNCGVYGDNELVGHSGYLGGDNYGVGGINAASGNEGFLGGDSSAVRGVATSPDDYAGLFEGKVSVTDEVGIGTTHPDEELHVVGSIKMVDGNEAAGYVMTSDANGVGSWQAASGGSYWAVIDSVLYTNNKWGLARGNSGNLVYGANSYGHVNVGVNCTTGTSGSDRIYCTVSGGIGNKASYDFCVVGGGYHNVASGNRSTVCGGESNTASGYASIVGAGRYNLARGEYSVIAGGGGDNPIDSNKAGGNGSVISGGARNIANGQFSVVGGGARNTAGYHYSTVGGGWDNTANGNYSTTGGGYENGAGGTYSTVGGGYQNEANGEYATVPGGYFNSADDYSFAAGMRAKAVHGGAFVWADHHTNADFSSTASDQFLIRANGGVGIGTNSPTEQLHVIGSIRMVDGNAAAGYVMTSDANGVGSWQAVTSSFSDSTDAITDGGVDFADIGQNGATTNQVIKWNGSAWAAADDETESGYWSVTDSVLYTNNYWGIARGGVGNVINGDSSYTVVNLGVACTTGYSPGYDDDIYCTIGGGYGHHCYSLYSTIAGGKNNWSTFFGFVGGGESNSASGCCSGVAAGYDNTASDSGSFVGGGWENGAWKFSTVSGGRSNWIWEKYSTIGGGDNNTADSAYCTIGGGQNNRAGWNYATISGGAGNQVYGQCGTVCGGAANINQGGWSTILGGSSNTIGASTSYSMAFGNVVNLTNSYRIAFFDGNYSGRVGINRDDLDPFGGIAYPIHVGTNTMNGNGAYLTNGGVWTNGSSRAFKENFKSLDEYQLLSIISNMQIDSWNFKNSDEKHIGPIAEDFVEAFDVGIVKDDGARENRYLAAGDVAGVALAGVQALLKKIDQLETRIAELEAEQGSKK